jgi:hypothetical protein
LGGRCTTGVDDAFGNALVEGVAGQPGVDWGKAPDQSDAEAARLGRFQSDAAEVVQSRSLASPGQHDGVGVMFDSPSDSEWMASRDQRRRELRLGEGFIQTASAVRRDVAIAGSGLQAPDASRGGPFGDKKSPFGSGAAPGPDVAGMLGAEWGGSSGQGTFQTRVTTESFVSGLMDMYVGGAVNFVPATLSTVANGWVGLANVVSGRGPQVVTIDLRPWSYTDEFAGHLGEFGAGFLSPSVYAQAQDKAVKIWLRGVYKDRPDLAQQAYSSALDGTRRLDYSLTGETGFRTHNIKALATEGGNYMAVQRPRSPAESVNLNALSPKFGASPNLATELWQVTSKPSFIFKGTTAPQSGLYQGNPFSLSGGNTQIFAPSRLLGNGNFSVPWRPGAIQVPFGG